MKYARLLLLLMGLAGCKDADPPGTLHPNADNYLEISDVGLGDSTPFKLNGGDISFFYSLSSGISYEEARHCETRMQLVKHKQRSGIEIPMAGNVMGDSRINSIEKGVYHISTSVKVNYCRYSVFIGRPDKSP